MKTARIVCLILSVATACLVAILLTKACIHEAQKPKPPEPPPKTYCLESVVSLDPNHDDDATCASGQVLKIEEVHMQVLAICRCITPGDPPREEKQ